MNWLHAGGQTVPNMLQIEGESLWKSQISPGRVFLKPVLRWNIPLSSFKPPVGEKLDPLLV